MTFSRATVPRSSWVLVAALSLLGSACGGSTSAAAKADRQLVTGRAVASPTCGAVSRTTPCPPRPVTGAVIVVRDAQGAKVARAKTDKHGRFKLKLGPGSYVVEGRPVKGIINQPPPAKLTVRAGERPPKISLAYDTGIR